MLTNYPSSGMLIVRQTTDWT